MYIKIKNFEFYRMRTLKIVSKDFSVLKKIGSKNVYQIKFELKQLYIKK